MHVRQHTGPRPSPASTHDNGVSHVASLGEQASPSVRTGPQTRRESGAPVHLPPNTMPEPALDGAERHDVAFQGGMMGMMTMVRVLEADRYGEILRMRDGWKPPQARLDAQKRGWDANQGRAIGASHRTTGHENHR